MAPPSITDVKKSLNFVWGKESDLNETYSFEFSSSTSWACVRSNGGESRRFRLTFDATACRLWWGESYFTDPSDLVGKPERVQWYRAADRVKKKAAFLWRRLRAAKPGNLEANQVSSKASSKSGGYPSAPRAAAKAPSSASKPSVSWVAKTEDKAEKLNEAAPVKAPSGQKKSSSTTPRPEVMLDFEEMLVIYKPPYWKVELPAKELPQDGLYLPGWMREKIPSIDPKLFQEEFNPALSGTGFGPLSHRIDQETSGPLLAAKTPAAQKHLRAQFHKMEVSKRYICLVHGKLKKSHGTIDALIRTLRTDSTTRSEISGAGEGAETEYHVVATFDGRSKNQGYSLVACDIKTGRTHQIRVHMHHLGHPLVADDKYFPEEIEKDRSFCPRLFLHSYRLRFRNTRGEDQVVICPLPPDLKAALAKLGAADPSGPSSDTLFDENSWQWEVFRPPLAAWRPGTQVQRRVIQLLASGPAPISELNGDEELKRLMADEGLTSINKAWLAKNWDVFKVEAQKEAGEVCLQLRNSNAMGTGTSDIELERQIEAVRSELEELERLKQRAIAEEKYLQAAEIKKRAEATRAELASLEALLEEVFEGQEEGAAPVRGLLDISGLDLGLHSDEAARKIPKRPKAEAFKQDVQDEALFPSLVSKTAKPISAPPKVPEPERRDGSAVDTRAASEPVGPSAAAGAASEPVLLQDALMEFLDRKEGHCAHINEVNNDRHLRQVMAAQLPKPINAVNKVWLKQHESLFTLLRTADNEMYVAKTKAIADQKAKAKAKAAALEQQRQPAYHQVVQQSYGQAPLIYEYGSAARKQEDLSSSGEAPAWQEKFRQALERVPSRTLPAEELLAAVPLFAIAMGAKRPREQQEVLVMCLGEWSKVFKVEKQGFVGERKYMVSLK
eukprot:TRINITY_DN27194_c0_g1_i1.p1 TRINITY_DN27194_c0_g1~~TRINITY_DN27194_c0_g1_i1.p1  ORF type:complete len:898 (-),score=235.77 TRINITY_DN27194_c0_g1_i1:26-2719(-)